jgi:Histone-like transcription factor (CBF/NF-Y) and archaeal histone
LGLKLNKIKEEIEAMPRSKLKKRIQYFIDDLEKFKDQKLPLARIKKIMKSDEDVRVSLARFRLIESLIDDFS